MVENSGAIGRNRLWKKGEGKRKRPVNSNGYVQLVVEVEHGNCQWIEKTTVNCSPGETWL